MIINFLINLILLVFGSIFVFFPQVFLNDIPLIGDFIVSTLELMVSYWNSFLVTFPYAQIAWQVFLYVIIPFEFLMLLGKFFLGSRMPSHHK